MAYDLGVGASPAEAYAQHFCAQAFLAPNSPCGNHSTQNHWDRTRNRYLGHEAHNVRGCVYQVHFPSLALRNGIIPCARTWSSPTWNPMGHNYGVTTAPSFASYIKAGANCCAHTFTGWTSNNQTDG
jgi:hypothetical protein